MIYAIDFETYYDQDCSVAVLGPVAYVNHPKFNIICMSLVADQTNIPVLFGVADMTPGIWERVLQPGNIIIAHNMRFEIEILHYLVNHKVIPQLLWDRVTPQQFLCTMDLAAYCGCRGSLEDAAFWLLGKKIDKHIRDVELKGKTIEDLKQGGIYEDVLRYCGLDATASLDLFRKYQDRWPQHERDLSVATRESARRGICVDQLALAAGKQQLKTAIITAEQQLPWVMAGYKPRSPKGFAKACADAGVTPPTTTAKNTIEWQTWLEAHSNNLPFAGGLISYRSLTRINNLLDTIVTRCNQGKTDRFDFSLRYFGSHTGRWSGTGGFNIQNLNSKDVGGVDLRGLLLPDSGCRWLICDYAQIEPRVLLVLAGDKPTLDLVARGMSPYEAYARSREIWTRPEPLKQTNPGLYKQIKCAVLGLGYGMGAERYYKTYRKECGFVDITAAKTAIDQYRANSPAIVALWGRMHNKLQASVGSTMVVKLPSGRNLSFFNLTRTPPKIDISIGDDEIFFQPRLGDGYNRLYGAKVVENITQAIARDIMADGLLRLVSAGVDVRFTVHDELVLNMPAADAPAAVPLVRDILSAPPAWMDIPLDVEITTHERYIK